MENIGIVETLWFFMGLLAAASIVIVLLCFDLFGSTDVEESEGPVCFGSYNLLDEWDRQSYYKCECCDAQPKCAQTNIGEQ